MSPDQLLGRLLERLGEVGGYELLVNAPYAIALCLVGAEVAWLAGRGASTRRAVLTSAATASVMAGGAYLVGIFYTSILQTLWAVVAGVRYEPLADLWRDHPIPGAVAAFVAWDLSGWIYHLIGHRTRIGWAAHQPHHSGVNFDATLGLRQSWVPFHGLIHQPLLALAGFDLRVIVACAAVSNAWQVLEHSSVPVRFPAWFSAVIMTPAAHRHHHGRQGLAVNLGPVFTFWDRLAGTWVSPALAAPEAYGSTAAPATANPVAVELAGWVALLGGGGAAGDRSERRPQRKRFDMARA